MLFGLIGPFGKAAAPAAGKAAVSSWQAIKGIVSNAWQLVGNVIWPTATVAAVAATGAAIYHAGANGVTLPKQEDVSKAYSDAAAKLHAFGQHDSLSGEAPPKKLSLAEQMRLNRATPILDGGYEAAPISAAPVLSQAPEPSAAAAPRAHESRKLDPIEDVLEHYVRNYEALREATESKATNRVDAFMLEREKLSLEISSRISILPGSPRMAEVEAFETARAKPESKPAMDDLFENLEALQKQ